MMEEAACMFKGMKVEQAKLEVHVFTLEWDTLSDGGGC